MTRPLRGEERKIDRSSPPVSSRAVVSGSSPTADTSPPSPGPGSCVRQYRANPSRPCWHSVRLGRLGMCCSEVGHEPSSRAGHPLLSGGSLNHSPGDLLKAPKCFDFCAFFLAIRRRSRPSLGLSRPANRRAFQPSRHRRDTNPYSEHRANSRRLTAVMSNGLLSRPAAWLRGTVFDVMVTGTVIAAGRERRLPLVGERLM